MRVSRWGQTGPWKVTQFSEIRTQEETHTGGSGVRVTCGKEKTRGKGRETDESKETELVWVRKTHRKGEKMKFYSQDGVLRISFTNVKLKCWMNVQMYFRANCYKWGKYCVSWKSQLFLGRGKILNVTLISDGHFLPPVGQSLKGMFHGKLLIFSFQWSSVFFFLPCYCYGKQKLWNDTKDSEADLFAWMGSDKESVLQQSQATESQGGRILWGCKREVRGRALGCLW